jgi:hypothetical protein
MFSLQETLLVTDWKPSDNPDRTAMPWGDLIVDRSPAQYGVTIPAGLANGEYIVRHEVTAPVSLVHQLA